MRISFLGWEITFAGEVGIRGLRKLVGSGVIGERGSI
jgi:hypothetical protein